VVATMDCEAGRWLRGLVGVCTSRLLIRQARAPAREEVTT
jgi:hypothetical protein